MITAISYQYQMSKRYNYQMTEDELKRHPLPDSKQLQKFIEGEINYYSRFLELVKDLNSDPATKEIEAKIKTHFGDKVYYSINPKTKARRTYSIGGGITIHEDDKATAPVAITIP
jgi:hypothetical protein